MTTAEMMFSPVGELATERREEARKIFFALVAALLIHVLVGLVLALLGGVRSVPAPIEETPVELTIMDTTPVVPVKPKNTTFIETPDKNAPAPKEKTFESNANSIAAGQQPATGDLPLPSQEGKVRPALDLETHDYSLANQGTKAQPSVAPERTPQVKETPRPQSTTAPEQFAMLRATPTPAPEAKASVKPQQQASSYQSYKDRTRVSGRITNRGISAVDAFGTPLGRYSKFLVDAIGSRWYSAVGKDTGLYGIGTVRLSFHVDRNGHVQNLKVVEKSSTEAFVNVCIQSVQDAQLPPMSEDLAATLPPDGLEVDDLPFVIFPN